MTKSSPHPVDVHVGARIRTLRKLRKLSQSKLGDQIGLTFQQIQKYEHGANRVGASRLHELSHILDVPVSYFFDDMPEKLQEGTRSPAPYSPPENDPYHSADVRELLRAFHSITDTKKRRAITEMAKSLSKPKVTV
jgi:transcriptional regulator with XRE-family HTH domain